MTSGKTNVVFDAVIPNVKQWSAEIPNLYELIITLKNGDKVVEVIRQEVGFRTSEIKNGNLLINGKYVYLKGANIHEHNDTTGHVQDKETMLRDIKINESQQPECGAYIALSRTGIVVRTLQ